MTLHLTGTDLSAPGTPDDAPLLVVGPSLGTSVAALWAEAAALLAPSVRVVGWDLPGHGADRPDPGSVEPLQAFTMADLAAAVVRLVDEVEPGARFHYAGDSVGGAVGLQLALDFADRVLTVAPMCTGARIGTAEGWHERAATVRASGAAATVTGAAERWFAPDFLTRRPDTASSMLMELREIGGEGYARTCEALAAFDVVDRLASIRTPVLAVAGALDGPTPPQSLATIADGVADGRLVVLDDVAHLAPVEAPETVARLVLDHVGASA